jgi:hypothetical protein
MCFNLLEGIAFHFRSQKIESFFFKLLDEFLVAIQEYQFLQKYYFLKPSFSFKV